MENKSVPYDVWQQNPSHEVAFPAIESSIFQPGGALELLGERSYDNEAKLEEVEAAYRSIYPKLFDQLAALAVLRARDPSVFNDVEATMQHYYRGAVFTLLALEASSPEVALRDLSENYANLYVEKDIPTLVKWIRYMQVNTSEIISPLTHFINKEYGWILEGEHLRTAMHVGTQHTYILLAHSRACIEREKEIAWMTRDDESFEGWLEYRENNYSMNAM